MQDSAKFPRDRAELLSLLEAHRNPMGNPAPVAQYHLEMMRLMGEASGFLNQAYNQTFNVPLRDKQLRQYKLALIQCGAAILDVLEAFEQTKKGEENGTVEA